MTNEEAIAILEEEAEFLYGEDKPHNRTAFDMAKKALSVPEKEKWIPVSSVEEIPKEPIWVTHKGADYAYVEVLGWDSQRNCRTEDGGFRCGSDSLKDVIAYMPYSEPEPYKAESEE